MDKAYWQGYKDAHEGNHDNPYCGEAAEEWQQGWEDAGGCEATWIDGEEQ